MDNDMLSATLRRCGPAASRRALLLFYCLRRVELKKEQHQVGAPSAVNTEGNSSSPTVAVRSSVVLRSGMSKAALSTPAKGKASNTSKKSGADEDDDDDDDDGSCGGTRVSIPSVISVVRFAIGAPRFIFICGLKGAVLRSADKGANWRKLNTQAALDASKKSAALSLSSAPAVATTKEEEKAADAKSLEEILSLLPSKEEDENQFASSEEEGSCSASDESGGGGDEDAEQQGDGAASGTGTARSKKKTKKKEKEHREDPASIGGPSDLHCIATSGECVAAAGADGAVAMSPDKGQTWHYMPRPPLIASKQKAGVGGRHHPLRRFLTFRSVAFLSPTSLVLHAASSVFHVPFSTNTTTGSSTSAAPGAAAKMVITFGEVRLLRRFQDTIGACVVTPSSSFPIGGLAPSSEMIVSTHGALHFSRDGGTTFTTVLHTMGLLRAVVPLADGETKSNRSSAAVMSATNADDKNTKGNKFVLPQIPREVVVDSLMQHQQPSAEDSSSRGGSGNKERTKKYFHACTTTTTACNGDEEEEEPKTRKTSSAAGSSKNVLLPTSFYSVPVASKQGEQLRSPVTPASDCEVGAVPGKLRAFAVEGRGSQVVAYDFTAVLFIWRPDDNDVRSTTLFTALRSHHASSAADTPAGSSTPIPAAAEGDGGGGDTGMEIVGHQKSTRTTVSPLFHTCAVNFSPLPFVSSAVTEPIGLVALPSWRSGGCGRSLSLVLSTCAGVSRSDDLGQSWAVLGQAFTGRVALLEEGAFVAAGGQKSVVLSQDYGASTRVVAVPNALRMPAVNDVAVMW